MWREELLKHVFKRLAQFPMVLDDMMQRENPVHYSGALPRRPRGGPGGEGKLGSKDKPSEDYMTMTAAGLGNGLPLPTLDPRSAGTGGGGRRDISQS